MNLVLFGDTDEANLIARSAIKNGDHEKMEIVKKTDAIMHENSTHCTVYEYPMKNSEMNIGVAEIRGRYPEQGYAINHLCSEMGYILKGSGKLVAESGETTLSEGDVIYVPAGEQFFWSGTMTVVLSATPAWSPEQHETNLYPSFNNSIQS